jgi:hypothetical protein
MQVDNSALSIVVAEPSKKPNGNDKEADKPTELIPKALERLTLTVNPSYLQRLKAAKEIGYERPFSQRRPQLRFYEIQIKNFRDAMTYVLSNYITWKFHEQGSLTNAQITSEVNEIVPICVDACMTALYAKLRVIHKQYGKYSTRFNTPPTYSKEIELPLPFADAIQNLGVFETRCKKSNSVLVPVYPEGTKHEGRVEEEWNAAKYESCMPILRDCGIPLKNIDPRMKFGHAWWTYKIEKISSTYDFRCILPLLHYSQHSAITASMFLILDEQAEVAPVIKHLNDDVNYGTRLREVKPGFQIRAFSALCHAHNEEWNSFVIP